jgi:excisionase family DNA binding protein
MSGRPTFEPISLCTKDASKAVGIPPRTLQDMAKAGKIPAKRSGRQYIFPLEALREWVNNLPAGDAN